MSIGIDFNSGCFTIPFSRTNTTKRWPPAIPFPLPKTDEQEVSRHGQSAGSKNRAGEGHVPKRQETR